MGFLTIFLKLGGSEVVVAVVVVVVGWIKRERIHLLYSRSILEICRGSCIPHSGGYNPSLSAW